MLAENICWQIADNIIGSSSCRGLIRNILRNCVKCINERATPQNNLMGDVPKERVSIGDKPFLNSGIDYFGPYHD